MSRSIAIVGSGPGCLDNKRGFIDSHDLVVRVNNYKLTPETGYRTDVFYSFFGSSIRKPAAELIRDGVSLCVCKCPDGHVIHSEWHKRHGRMRGVDFSYIYQNRKDWWFCDTYIPPVAEFMETFDLLGKHVPTTGFSAIQFVLSCAPKSVYLTGFDFFKSCIHNVNEPWKARNMGDPIAHDPQRELAWLIANCRSKKISLDKTLRIMIAPYADLT